MSWKCGETERYVNGEGEIEEETLQNHINIL